MAATTHPEPHLVAGIDPHADTIHVAVVTEVGKPMSDAEFRTDPAGYAAAVEFLTSAGLVDRVGVEGAAGYGAGITRALVAAGLEVVEVERPTRSARRRAGKTDQMDAYHAARSVLAERTSPIKGAAIDGIRALNLARRSAVKARTAALNQLKAVLVMAPDDVRSPYRGLTTERLIDALLRARCRANTFPTSAATLTALKSLARRHRDLGDEIKTLTGHLDTLVTAANPALRATYGVGPDVAAQLLITAGNNPDRLTSEASFAALCGAAPVPASSGKTQRHRLSRGGDRQANAALHRIVLNRASHHPPTRAYVARQTERGRTPREIRRMLKRAVVREIHRLLTRDCPVAAFDDLRPARQAKNITLRQVLVNPIFKCRPSAGTWSRPGSLELRRRRRGQLNHRRLELGPLALDIVNADNKHAQPLQSRLRQRPSARSSKVADPSRSPALPRSSPAQLDHLDTPAHLDDRPPRASPPANSQRDVDLEGPARAAPQHDLSKPDHPLQPRRPGWSRRSRDTTVPSSYAVRSERPQ